MLVGVTGLELRRDLFYKKELSFQVSCSYGPGRYDPSYEQYGHDYPIGFVRWSEQRNFQAVLNSLSSGTLRTESLISHRFPIDKAAEAYELLSSPEPSLGILLRYPETADPEQRDSARADAQSVVASTPLLSASELATMPVAADSRFCQGRRCFNTLAASSGIGPVCGSNSASAVRVPISPACLPISTNSGFLYPPRQPCRSS